MSFEITNVSSNSVDRDEGELDGERVRANDDDGRGGVNVTREAKGEIQEESYARHGARRKGMREWGEREDQKMVRTFHPLVGCVNNVLVVDVIDALVLASPPSSSRGVARDPWR